MNKNKLNKLANKVLQAQLTISNSNSTKQDKLLAEQTINNCLQKCESIEDILELDDEVFTRLQSYIKN